MSSIHTSPLVSPAKGSVILEGIWQAKDADADADQKIFPKISLSLPIDGTHKAWADLNHQYTWPWIGSHLKADVEQIHTYLCEGV